MNKKYTIKDFKMVVFENLQEFKDKFGIKKEPEKQICYKNNNTCKYNCKGLCKESC